MSTGLEEQVEREQAEYDEGLKAVDDDSQTVEDMDPEEVEPTPPMQVPLEGFHESVSVVVGGDRPQTATVAMRGGKLTVAGEFKKGDVVELYVRCRVAEVHFVDTVDKYGEVTGTERRHIAKPVAVRRLSASEE